MDEGTRLTIGKGEEPLDLKPGTYTVEDGDPVMLSRPNGSVIRVYYPGESFRVVAPDEPDDIAA